MYRMRTAWALGLGLLVAAGLAYAGEPLPFKETARVTLHRELSRGGQWDEQQELDEMAFVTNRWISVNGDASDANSWSGGLPAVNDVCVFDSTSQQSMTTGLGVATFSQLLIKPSYRGQIGFSGNPWRVSLGTGVLVYRGSGQAFINPETGVTASVVVDVNRHLGSNDYSLVLGGMGVGTTGTIATLAVKRGRARVLGDIHFGGDVYTLGSGAELLCDTDLGALNDPPNIYAHAGYTENKREVQANGIVLVAAGSTLTQVGVLPTSAHVVVVGNGRFAYLPVAAPGTTPRLSVLGGVYDQSQEQFDSAWGSAIIGPDARIVGGVIRGTGLWPPGLDLRDEYPGEEE